MGKKIFLPDPGKRKNIYFKFRHCSRTHQDHRPLTTSGTLIPPPEIRYLSNREGIPGRTYIPGAPE
jgi:hypothetical protein